MRIQVEVFCPTKIVRTIHLTVAHDGKSVMIDCGIDISVDLGRGFYHTKTVSTIHLTCCLRHTKVL